MTARRLVVEADGGSRGNPGVAGYGALVRDADTRAVLAERAAPLGKASNNVAEYSGLIAGLEAAARIDPAADVEVRMDSNLVVEQMAGRWKIKHEDMRRLALAARELCSARSAAGGSVTFTWIPRADNKAADALSNDGMDGRTIDRSYAAPDAAPGAAPDAATPATSATTTVAEAPVEPRQSEPDLTPPTRVLLVRHGVTDHTLRAQLDGRGGGDPGLNTQGREQASDVARAVRALVGRDVRVVTSGLYRARQTGAVLGERLGVTPTADDRFDEQGFGDWDGKSMGQISARWPDELVRLRTDQTYARPGGESHEQLRERVLAGWHDLVAAGGTTVLVGHRKPFLVILTDLLGIAPEGFWRLALAPGSLTGVEVWRDGNAVVSFVNRTDHLGD
ncbi:bifunctional RNase H/acid phosphatase [Arsenicicoccus sp. oral taxon 190]|uniref:bifunctional RNase H/acid phosphatase n=1 Tax=Arsenicicoccus sp. oral taxon 190 TaxID=1658671 RepID=UPI00067A315E|nr:bifunctional RNase H/acid phosphatase [Arsenicicoccus sp. oral taxon 190]AKT52120.1 ribonuclease HI [Arsenicicoccus sp. oral taxon 190]